MINLAVNCGFPLLAHISHQSEESLQMLKDKHYNVSICLQDSGGGDIHL